jgi:hypothetical protein
MIEMAPLPVVDIAYRPGHRQQQHPRRYGIILIFQVLPVYTPS